MDLEDIDVLQAGELVGHPSSWLGPFKCYVTQ